MNSNNRRSIAELEYQIKLAEIAMDEFKARNTPMTDLFVKQKEVEIEIAKLRIKEIIEMDKLTSLPIEKPKYTSKKLPPLMVISNGSVTYNPEWKKAE